MTTGTFVEWAYEVDRQLRVRTKKAWVEYKDLRYYVTDRTRHQAYVDGKTPKEFVDQIIKVLGLTDFGGA